MTYTPQKKEMIYWAGLLNQRGLVTVRSGNVSCKLDQDTLLITAHDSYLGHLKEEELVVTDIAGNVLDGRVQPTSEKELHCDIHAQYREVNVILHAHPPFTVAFFHYFDTLDIVSFESKMYLGNVAVIGQDSPIVTDVAPVVNALSSSGIVVLKDHGVVAIGREYREAFGLIELLEEQARVNLITGRGGSA